jgi:hypothetical protein
VLHVELGFEDSGFGGLGSGSGVEGLGLRVRVWVLGFGFGCRFSGFGVGFRVWVLAPGTWYSYKLFIGAIRTRERRERGTGATFRVEG